MYKKNKIILIIIFFFYFILIYYLCYVQLPFEQKKEKKVKLNHHICLKVLVRALTNKTLLIIITYVTFDYFTIKD